MPSRLSLAAAASLTVFGIIIAVAAAVLAPALFERVTARSQPPHARVMACLDPSCLPRLPGHDITVIAAEPAGPAANEMVAGKSPLPGAPEPPATAPSPAFAKPVATIAIRVPQPENTPIVRSLAAAPQAEPVPNASERTVAHVPLPRARRPVTAALEAPARGPAARKPVRREAAKRATTEALRAVRRFGDKLDDIPASSYAADGTRRTITIHPTSVQDVYYYSIPR